LKQGKAPINSWPWVLITLALLFIYGQPHGMLGEEIINFVIMQPVFFASHGNLLLAIANLIQTH